MTLYAPNGARKYVNRDERERFLRAADAAGPKTRTLCLTLAYTGCRISEALALTLNDIQQDARVLSIRTLKKRRQNVVREVPAPGVLVSALTAVHSIEGPHATETDGDTPLWAWGRTTAWERVKGVMVIAGVVGPQATPRGLRHGYGVHAIQHGVPLNLVQKWLGHASLSTTAIYADAVGPEEQAIASRMW